MLLKKSLYFFNKPLSLPGRGITAAKVGIFFLSASIQYPLLVEGYKNPSVVGKDTNLGLLVRILLSHYLLFYYVKQGCEGWYLFGARIDSWFYAFKQKIMASREVCEQGIMAC